MFFFRKLSMIKSCWELRARRLQSLWKPYNRSLVFPSPRRLYITYTLIIQTKNSKIAIGDRWALFFSFSKISIGPLSAPPKPPYHPEIPLDNSDIGPCNLWEKRICFIKPIVQQIMSSAKLKTRFTTTMRVIFPASPILKIAAVSPMSSSELCHAYRYQT